MAYARFLKDRRNVGQKYFRTGSFSWKCFAFLNFWIKTLNQKLCCTMFASFNLVCNSWRFFLSGRNWKLVNQTNSNKKSKTICFLNWITRNTQFAFLTLLLVRNSDSKSLTWTFSWLSHFFEFWSNWNDSYCILLNMASFSKFNHWTPWRSLQRTQSERTKFRT